MCFALRFASSLFLALLASLSLACPLSIGPIGSIGSINPIESIGWTAKAHAQSEKILVVSGTRVPDRLQSAVVDTLEHVGSVMDPSGYAGNLRARNQAPDSEEALTKLAPQMGASLIVVLSMSRGKLEVTFRNGHTGSVISDEKLPARGRRAKLGGGARRKLAGAARRALSKVGPAPSSSSSSFATAEPSRPAPSRPKPPVRVQPTPTPQEDEEEEEEEAEDEEESEPGEEEAEDAQDAGAGASSAEDPISFVLIAGGGVGTRSVLVPTREGGTRLDTAYMPALDLGVALDVELGTNWMLRAGGAYRTVFGLTAGELLPTGAVRESSLSSHSLSLGASLGYLTDGTGSLALHLYLGWTYRGLSAPDGTNLPSVSVSGPAIRPELHIPMGKLATLRIAPEIIIVVNSDATLPLTVPGLEPTGFAYGGEASVDFHLSSTVHLGVMFRESRASVGSGWGIAAVENERYMVGRLTLTL